MTHSMLKTLVAALGLALTLASPLFSASTAEAGGRGKEFFQETYRLKKPLHGFEGRAGDYYCSYIRKPVHQIDANGRMKVVAWELQQHCY